MQRILYEAAIPAIPTQQVPTQPLGITPKDLQNLARLNLGSDKAAASGGFQNTHQPGLQVEDC